MSATFTYILPLNAPDSRVAPSWKSLPHQVLTPKSESELQTKQVMYGKLGGPTLPEVVINLTIVSGVLDVDEDQTPACALIMDYHFKQMVDKRRQVLFDNIEINLSLLDANQGHYSQLYPELMHMVPGPPWRKTTGNLQIDPSTKFFYRNTLSDTVPLTAGLGTGHWKPDVIDKKNIWTCSGQAHLSQESGIESLSGTISHKPIRDKPLPGTGPGSVFPRDSNTAYWVLKNTSKQDTLRFLRTGLLIKSNLAMRIHMLINIKAGIAREYQTGRLINFYSGAGRLVGSHDDRGILDIPGTLEDLISFKGSTPEVFNPEGGLDLIDHMHLHLRKINLLNLTGVAEESIELEEKGVEPGSMGVEASDHWKEETLSLAFKVHKTLDIFLQEPLPTSQLEISPELVEWENPTMFGQFTATLEDLQNVWGPSGESDESEPKQYHAEIEVCKAMEQIVNGGPDLGLGFDSSFFKESSYADKGMLTDVLEKQQESLRKLAGSFKGKDEPTIKRELLNFMKTSSQELKDVTRKFVFASPQMQSMDVVKNARTSEIFAKCDLHLDAGVRSMIMEQMKLGSPASNPTSKKSVDIQSSSSKTQEPLARRDTDPPTTNRHRTYIPLISDWELEFRRKSDTSGGPEIHQNKCLSCKHCFPDNAAAGLSELPEALKYVDGNYSESLEDNFIGLPGQLDGLYNVKALIDTGGGVNLISREWLKKKGIGIISTETSRLQNADTSISEPLPVMRMSWKFDDRNIIWTGVKFLVTETGPDALLGLPFLRHTQVIHDSKGHLVFPELADIPSPSPTANVYPIYHTKKVGPDA